MGKSKFTVALSGGSTPKILFELLAAEYLDKFNWENIHFFGAMSVMCRPLMQIAITK
ncbi:MAG: hypothetical protein HC892_10255 [Saprospiraceae bacterium]|nr:hypothetical protein [Saprospiraceae bacterium]